MPSELSICYVLIWVLVTATAAGDEHYSDYANEKMPDYGNYPSDYDASPDRIYTATPDYYDEKPEPPGYQLSRPSLDYKDEDDSDKQHYPAEKFQNPIRNHRMSNRKSPGSFDYNSEDIDITMGRTERSGRSNVPKFRPKNKGRDFDNDDPKRPSPRYDRYNKHDVSGDNAEEDVHDTKHDLLKEKHNGNGRTTTTERVVRRKPRAKYMKYGTKDDDRIYTPGLPDSFDDDIRPKPKTTLLAEGRKNIFHDAVFSDTARKRKYYKEYEDYYDLKRIQRLKQKLAAQKDSRTFTPIEPMLSIRSSTETTENWLIQTTNFKRMDFKRIKKTEREVTDLFMEYIDNFDPKKPYHEVDSLKSKQAKVLSRLRNPKSQPQKKQDGEGSPLWLNNETEGMSNDEKSRIIDLEVETGGQRPHHLQEERLELMFGKNTTLKDRRNENDTNIINNIGYDNTDTITSQAKGKIESTQNNSEDDTKTIEAWTNDNTKSEQTVSLSLRKYVTRKIIVKTTEICSTTTTSIGQKIIETTQAPNRSTSEEQSTMMSFVYKTNLSIQKKAQTKEMLKVLVTKKPMRITNKSYTKIMVEPSTSEKLDHLQEVYNDVSPEQLLKIKRIMRYKILDNAKSVRDLNENWDELVCDYIDMSLLNEISAGTVGVANFLILFLSIFNA